MFSGIIRNQGRVEKIQVGKDILLQISAPKLSRQLKSGDSLAVDGVCLTVLESARGLVSFELIPQTWKVTRFSFHKPKDTVNLERPLTLTDYVDGHLLMGHVDGLGKVQNILKKKNLREIEVAPPHPLKKFIALRGAVAVNGVSLTVSHLTNKTFKVSLTDYTIKNTNLGLVKKGDKVNLEIDMVSRYLDNLLKSYES